MITIPLVVIPGRCESFGLGIVTDENGNEEPAMAMFVVVCLN